jgi:hypothetical protein
MILTEYQSRGCALLGRPFSGMRLRTLDGKRSAPADAEMCAPAPQVERWGDPNVPEISCNGKSSGQLPNVTKVTQLGRRAGLTKTTSCFSLGSV